MKSPKLSYEEKEMTVGDTLRWLDKLEKVTSKGAKIAMVSMLLRRNQSDTLKRVREEMLLNFGKGNFVDKQANKVDCRNCYIKAFNDYHKKLVSLIKRLESEAL